ncbi:MAG: hypothetical protein QOK36_4204 [Gaiellales bacterium]|jgi:hypothetical protein|nr:hypothetical protein [Gaiellales bacterium]
MPRLNTRLRTLLGGAIAAGALVLPSAAFADCAKTVDTAAFRGTIAQYYPQACYTAGLKQLGPDVNTYSPNVARNLKAAQRRDRTRKLKFTIQWLPKGRVRISSNYKLKSNIQLRKGAKVLGKGSISALTTTLKVRKATGTLRVAALWKLGKNTTITVTGPATVAKKK